MQRQRRELVPIGEVVADLPGPVQALRKTPPPARRGFTVADQVNQLVGASEADPDRGFMAVLRPIFAASRNPPLPHHGRKRAVFVFAAFLLLSGGDALAQGSVADDKAALETLYDATDGSNWTTNTNWTTDEPLSAWHGVTTDTDGRVTQLFLNGNQLSGTIPAALGGLTNLQQLLLSDMR